MKEKTLLSSKDLERKTTRIVHEILEDNNDKNDIAIVGIKTRGEYLGRRIVKELNTIEKKEIPIWDT